MILVDRSFNCLAFLPCSLLRESLFSYFKILFIFLFLQFKSNVFKYLGNRKYEEIKPPEVEEFCYITDNTYSKEEVILVLNFCVYGLFVWFLSADFRYYFF